MRQTSCSATAIMQPTVWHEVQPKQISMHTELLRKTFADTFSTVSVLNKYSSNILPPAFRWKELERAFSL